MNVAARRTRGVLVLAVALLASSCTGSASAYDAGTISSGGSHTCQVISATVQCWGSNYSGQLGIGTDPATSGIPLTASNLTGVTLVGAGFAHTCAVAVGAAYCWGRNADGQLGVGDLVDHPTPQAVSGLGSGVSSLSSGAYNTCAIVDGGVYCWGRNDHGQVGNTPIGPSVTIKTPMIAGGPPPGAMTSGFTAVASGDSFTCVLRGDGRVFCFGLDNLSQLGQESPTPVAAGTIVTPKGLTSGVTAISAGQGQACAVQSGAAYCWGQNSRGEVGNGEVSSASEPVQVPTQVVGLGSGVTAIAAGNGYTCAIQSSVVKCWGDNTWGQLGDGTTTGSPVPVVASSYPFAPDQLTAGDNSGCAIGPVGYSCWGRNDSGQLGPGSTQRVVKFKLKRSGKSKVKGKSVKLKLKASTAVPAGVPASVACTGKLTVSFRPKGAKNPRKASAKLKQKGQSCVATLALKLPKKYKGKKVKLKLEHAGNAAFAATSTKTSYKVK